MEEERTGKGRWNRKKALGITIPPGLEETAAMGLEVSPAMEYEI